ICHDYGDAAGLLAERLGCRPARTIYTTLGGHTPQSLVNHLCDEIPAGPTEPALLAGAAAWHTAPAPGRGGRPSGRAPPRAPALLRAGEDAARRLALAAARQVYPWAGVDDTEHCFFQDRADSHTLPGLRRAGALLLAAVGLGTERVQHLDLYSCSPIAARL